ncbi:MAG: 2'-5' RNA ligase family protein [Eubacteriales bacterium]|nr:2'-5' RNA ligase family protein [Eubacteriales bacterium]
MAERFLCVLAHLDAAGQAEVSRVCDALRQAGFIGRQTPGLYHHITLGTFAPGEEARLTNLLDTVARDTAPVEIHYSHLGLFGTQVLFLAPDLTPALSALQAPFDRDFAGSYDWTPHTTLLIDDQPAICAALPAAAQAFTPFTAHLDALSLYEFYPTRFIALKKLRTDA